MSSSSSSSLINLPTLTLVNSIELNVNSTAPSSSSTSSPPSNNCDQIQTVFKFENENTTDSSSNEFVHYQHITQHHHANITNSQEHHRQQQQQSQQPNHQQHQLQLPLSLTDGGGGPVQLDFSTTKATAKLKANGKPANKSNKKENSASNKNSTGRNSKQSNNFLNSDIMPNKKLKKCNAKISSLKTSTILPTTATTTTSSTSHQFDEFDSESNDMSHKNNTSFSMQHQSSHLNTSLSSMCCELF